MEITYKFCPQCSQGLTRVMDNGQQYPGCVPCGFIHYNNPVPVAAVIVPVDDKIVLVQRKKDPQAGGWCLPCGYVNELEAPKDAGIREVREETGLVIVITRILDALPPMPRKGKPGNQNINFYNFYEGKIIGGELRAGDDALDVGLFSRGERPICFGSHEYVVENWYKER